MVDPTPLTRKPGTFMPGNDPRRVIPTKRKPKGPNKVSRDLRNGIIEGAIAAGADGAGKGGLLGYLTNLAVRHPKAYAGLLGRVLPMQISGSVGHHIQSVNIISVPSDSFLSQADIARLTAPKQTLELEPATESATESADDTP